jgi:hypothetical protein
MYIALFSVGFGSLLTLAQAGLLFSMLEIDNYVSFRAILNTMNIAAPFLCLGFDSAAPILKRMNPNFPFFWNLLATQILLLLFFLSISLILPVDSKSLSVSLGLVAATSAAGALMVSNYYRVENNFNKYFISINVTDKLVRTFIIVISALLIQEKILWSLIVTFFYFSYVFLLALSTGCKFQINFRIFKSHLHKASPFLLSALGIILITRLPFYAAYFYEDSLLTAKVDIWLLFSIFLLIPMLNKSKVEEVFSAGVMKNYILRMHFSWPSILVQELLICTGIVAFATVAIFLGYASRDDLFFVILPLISGMVIIASVPNYLQLTCFANKFLITVVTSIAIVIIAIMSYLPKIFFADFSIQFLFILSSILYCLVGFYVANILEIKLSYFWRWRDSLFVIFISAIELIIVNLYFEVISS